LMRGTDCESDMFMNRIAGYRIPVRTYLLFLRVRLKNPNFNVSTSHKDVLNNTRPHVPHTALSYLIWFYAEFARFQV
jgi:hypothetical protein